MDPRIVVLWQGWPSSRTQDLEEEEQKKKEPETQRKTLT